MFSQQWLVPPRWKDMLSRYILSLASSCGYSYNTQQSNKNIIQCDKKLLQHQGFQMRFKMAMLTSVFLFYLYFYHNDWKRFILFSITLQTIFFITLFILSRFFPDPPHLSTYPTSYSFSFGIIFTIRSPKAQFIIYQSQPKHVKLFHFSQTLLINSLNSSEDVQSFQEPK